MTSAELISKYANPLDGSRFININGIDVHYRDEGTGFPVLLVHGTSSSLHTFDGWAAELKKSYRVLRFDLPGFGLSGQMPGNIYDMRKYLDVINDFLQKMNVEKCHIAGSSLGGWFVWEFALRFPARVSKMILIDAAGFINMEKLPVIYKIARMAAGRWLFLCARNRFLFSMFLKGVYGNFRNVDKNVVDRYYDLFFRKENLEAFIHLAKADPVSNIDKLSDINAPTLIIWGDRDRWVSIGDGYRFQKYLPDARIRVYDGLGHIPMEEDPEITVRDVIDFFNGAV